MIPSLLPKCIVQRPQFAIEHRLSLDICLLALVKVLEAFSKHAELFGVLMGQARKVGIPGDKDAIYFVLHIDFVENSRFCSCTLISLSSLARSPLAF